MTTALDTNVLLDLIVLGAEHAEESRLRLEEAGLAGPLTISEPVYAELAGSFRDAAALEGFLVRTDITLSASSSRVLFIAGQGWTRYSRRRPSGLTCAICGNTQAVECSRCGTTLQSRQHVVADFLIGAHALVQADRLLTRDRGFYGAYFLELVLG